MTKYENTRILVYFLQGYSIRLLGTTHKRKTEQRMEAHIDGIGMGKIGRRNKLWFNLLM